MNARLFDMFHHASYDYVDSIGYSVHVDLDGIFQIFIYEDRMFRRGCKILFHI